MSPAILPPFGSNTASDKSGLILLASILNIILVVSSLPIRVYRKGKRLEIDDTVAILAAALSIAQCVPLLVGLHAGLGKSSNLVNKGINTDVEHYVFASFEIFFLALSKSKASAILFMRRLAGNGMPMFHVGCSVALGVVGSWCVGSMIGIAVGCNTTSRTMDCPNYVSRWVWIAAFDAITDVGVFALSWSLIAPLQMDWDKKAAVIITFGFRLTTIGFTAAHAITISAYTKAADPGIAIVWPLVWQITQATCAVTMSAAPHLAWIRQSFTLSAGGSSKRGIGLFGTGASDTGTYALTSFRKKGSPLRERLPRAEVPTLRPGNSKYTATIVAPQREPSIASGTSQADLIRCDVQYTVEHEDVGKQ